MKSDRIMISLHAQICQAIDGKRDALIDIVDTQLAQVYPNHSQREVEESIANLRINTQMHLDYLTQALAANSPALFVDHVAWSQVTLASRDIPTNRLIVNLESIDQALHQLLPTEFRPIAKQYITAGMEQLPQISAPLTTFLDQNIPLASLANDYLASLLRGERRLASLLILDALDNGVTVQDIYLQVFQRSQQEIGRLWQLNQLSVAQEHYCTAATQMIMSQLYPTIFANEKNGHTLVATCVSTELHEIGLRMVTDFLEMAGWDTYYIGANAPVADIVQTLISRGADLLAISVTMTPHLPILADIITAVRAEPACRNVKIMVGGYPFHIASDLWRIVGADGYADSAQSALHIAETLVQK